MDLTGQFLSSSPGRSERQELITRITAGPSRLDNHRSAEFWKMCQDCIWSSPLFWTSLNSEMTIIGSSENRSLCLSQFGGREIPHSPHSSISVPPSPSPSPSKSTQPSSERLCQGPADLAIQGGLRP